MYSKPSSRAMSVFSRNLRAYVRKEVYFGRSLPGTSCARALRALILVGREVAKRKCFGSSLLISVVKMVGRVGLEPTTIGLKVRCFTN